MKKGRIIIIYNVKLFKSIIFAKKVIDAGAFKVDDNN